MLGRGFPIAQEGAGAVEVDNAILGVSTYLAAIMVSQLIQIGDFRVHLTVIQTLEPSIQLFLLGHSVGNGISAKQKSLTF